MKQEDLNQPANERLTSPRRWLGQAAGIHGLSPGQQLAILTALAARQVVLLVGPHGTAKSLLPMKLADALGLEGRYFPAHMVQLEDLIGWVAPDVGNGKLVYFRGEASIFNTEYALFDELFRAPVRLQAKLLEILLEKRIMGEKTPLQHVWLAANPGAAEYHANPIDLALLARVGVMLEMPTTRDLDPEELSAVVSSWERDERGEDRRKWLPGVLERASSPELLEAVKQEDGEDLARYVENLMWTVLARYPDDADRMDGRTLNMVHRLLVHSRSVLEACGERSPLEQDSENIGLVVEQAFPTLRLRESQIYPFPLREMHEEAWQVTFGHGSEALRASTFLAVQTQSLENLVDRVLADDLFLDDSSAEDLVSKLETVLRDAGASPEEHAAAVASLTRLLVAQPGRQGQVEVQSPVGSVGEGVPHPTPLHHEPPLQGLGAGVQVGIEVLGGPRRRHRLPQGEARPDQQQAGQHPEAEHQSEEAGAQGHRSLPTRSKWGRFRGLAQAGLQPISRAETH